MLLESRKRKEKMGQKAYLKKQWLRTYYIWKGLNIQIHEVYMSPKRLITIRNFVGQEKFGCYIQTAERKNFTPNTLPSKLVQQIKDFSRQTKCEKILSLDLTYKNHWKKFFKNK